MRIAGKDLTIYITIYIDDTMHFQKETFIPDHTSQAGVLGNIVYISN
jgi:hypothetical protein